MDKNQSNTHNMTTQKGKDSATLDQDHSQDGDLSVVRFEWESILRVGSEWGHLIP